MTDPKRWADGGGDATAFERELFSRGRAAGLPPEEKRRRWLAIAEQAALLPATPQALAGKAATKGFAGWLKALTLLPALGAGAGVYALSHSHTDDTTSARRTLAAPAPVREVHQVDTATTDEPSEAVAEAPILKRVKPPARAPERRVEAPATPTSATSTVPDESAKSHLAEEARAVLEARNALRANNPSAALRVLEDARARFPNGSLGQEREALTIEGLAGVGRTDVARMRARAFSTRFPNSPLTANVRRFE